VKIRILRGFSHYEPGQVFEDWPGGMCEIFIERGMIEEVKDEVSVEVADDEPETERADASPRVKKPRK
jgi:hypothetical protein